MSRVLLDDRFPFHPKIRVLSDRHFRAWVKLLCLCSQQDEATVDEALLKEVRLSPRDASKLVSVGLLDTHGDRWAVHNFDLYNGASVEERVASYLRDHPDASANQVARQIPASRNAVLAAVRQYRDTGQVVP